MKRQIKFVGQGKLWFDKANGNTYNSVRVTRVKDGATIAGEFQYGYGDYYRQSGLEAMEKAGWIPAKWTGKHSNGFPKNMSYERENNYPIEWSVSHTKKREAEEWGKI